MAAPSERSRWLMPITLAIGIGFLPHVAAAQDAGQDSALRTASIDSTVETPAARAQACAAAYHSSFAAIASDELAALKAVHAAIGETDPALPGRMIFARRVPLGEEEAEAFRAAERLARRQGRASFATDANSRWIAERIRTDLSDYLTQPSSPFLCAGVANYLRTLRDYAGQVAPSPSAHGEAFAVQQRAAIASIRAVFDALAPAPLPRFARRDHREQGPSVADLRLAVTMDRTEQAEEPLRVAETTGGGSKISASGSDPDLPPLSAEERLVLRSERDVLRALDRLSRRLESQGVLAPSSAIAAKVEHARGEKAEGAGPRPVLVRLANLDGRLSASRPSSSDPRNALVLSRLRDALADLEALDYLRVAAKDGGDPLGAALYATMDAIEAAHAEACRCRT